MAQRVFTFPSPVNYTKMIEIIENVVSELNGKTIRRGNIVIAKWWNKGTTTFPHKYIFYVGNDIVRVTTGDMNNAYYKRVKWEFRCNPVLKLWNHFIKRLISTYPNYGFDLIPDTFHIMSAKVMSDGIEQNISMTSVSSPSIGGAVVGGALFGEVGAIVGGSRKKTRTSGTTRHVFSNEILVSVRYSNGFNLDGRVYKNSSLYNKIFMLNN